MGHMNSSNEADEFVRDMLGVDMDTLQTANTEELIMLGVGSVFPNEVSSVVDPDGGVATPMAVALVALPLLVVAVVAAVKTIGLRTQASYGTFYARPIR